MGARPLQLLRENGSLKTMFAAKKVWKGLFRFVGFVVAHGLPHNGFQRHALRQKTRSRVQESSVSSSGAPVSPSQLEVQPTPVPPSGKAPSRGKRP